MVYMIPVVGWAIGLFFHICLAIPFWIVWNILAPTYFYFLPEVYWHIGFWHCVGLFITFSILKFVLFPRFASSSSSSESK